MKIPTRSMTLGLLALGSAAALTVASNAIGATEAAAQTAGKMNKGSIQRMIAGWPQASRMAAMDMMQKYGPPQEVTATMLRWQNNGPWKYTVITNYETPHRFPMPHPDVMEQAIDYRVPAEMFDDLAAYDGSVTVDRTQGHLAARCDKEGANFLAINLAHDVATGKKSVEQARTYYAAAIKRFMSTKQMDSYMQRLQFQAPRQDTGDPDRSVI